MFPALSSLGGAGGFTGGAATATSGDAGGSAGSGNTTINFSPPKKAADVLTNPLLIVGALAVVYLLVRKK